MLPLSRLWRIGGRGVACVGDAVMCPKCGLTAIVDGDTDLRFGSVKVATHGNYTSCGATLIASLSA